LVAGERTRAEGQEAASTDGNGHDRRQGRPRVATSRTREPGVALRARGLGVALCGKVQAVAEKEGSR
jgi:hypothetical protein